MSDTSIRVTHELADELHDRKNRGDSYEDVIWRLINHAGDDLGPSSLEEMVARVERIDWDAQGGAKNDERVRALATAASLLKDRGMVAPIVLREEILNEFDLGLKESSVQRLISDNLPKVPEVETQASGQIYVWIEE